MDAVDDKVRPAVLPHTARARPPAARPRAQPRRLAADEPLHSRRPMSTTVATFTLVVAASVTLFGHYRPRPRRVALLRQRDAAATDTRQGARAATLTRMFVRRVAPV